MSKGMTCPRCTNEIPDPPPLRQDYASKTAYVEAEEAWRVELRGKTGRCACQRCPTCWDLIVKNACPCSSYRFLKTALTQTALKRTA